MDLDDATRYEQAGVDVQESLSGWAKQQEAALAEDQDPSLSLWDLEAPSRSRVFCPALLATGAPLLRRFYPPFLFRGLAPWDVELAPSMFLAQG